ncbi:BMP family protein [Paenibacillus sp. J5C_2022]|uniref:BMP family lipoprotein n=1 Tax=Paenibacillus sp. J5C2022 TaxID=2977129 RepID=UPI0021D0387A|nr:BMP family protein [Paenibacillus sp. J5C2022]MCU6710794.1 BMP family protein [Paenibacillus sp. J5C2022]
MKTKKSMLKRIRGSWRKTLPLMALVVVISLSGCGVQQKEESGNGNAGQSSGNEGAVESDNSGKDFRIGMVTDVGGVNDKSFNQSAWEALQRLNKSTSASTRFLESKGEADLEPNLNDFVREGYDLTWGIGYLFSDALAKVAKDNPDAKLAVVDTVVDAPNVTSVTFAEHEGSFLTGVVAGLMTKSDGVGFVGGMEIPVIKRFEAGFVAGVKAVKPDLKVDVVYSGAFDKPDLGKSIAATMYNKGVDIIFHASGGTGNGVFNEAIDRRKSGKEVWVIGVDKDQSLEFGDEVTLTSMMKGVEVAVYKVSKDLIDGKWTGGQVLELGLKDDAVGLPDTSTKNVPQDVLTKVEEFKQKIISGEIKVPTQ